MLHSNVLRHTWLVSDSPLLVLTIVACPVGCLLVVGVFSTPDINAHPLVSSILKSLGSLVVNDALDRVLVIRHDNAFALFKSFSSLV